MPTTQRKARLLLKEGKARIYCYYPFTIQLKYSTGESVQSISIGIDSGARYVGIAVTTKDKVLLKGVIELRKGVTKLLTTRKGLRRGRRGRLRYRKPRFLNRKRPTGWLPPSIQSRVDNTINWINKIALLLPNPSITVEVGKFDAHKLQNPNIKGKEYQEGKTFGFWNTRYYVFARDNYTCQICKKKGGILQTHHIISRNDGGTDRADNLATVHKDCHEGFHQGLIKHTFKKPKQYKETAFMNILRKQIFKRLNCKITYGSQTKIDRDKLGLEKSHFNDAIAISGIQTIKENLKELFVIRQFRKKKRSLHEQIPRKGRTKPNTEAKRNPKNTKMSKGLFLNDKVKVFDKVGWITGFTGTDCYIKGVDKQYIIRPGKTYKQIPSKNLEILNHNNNWQFFSIHPSIEIPGILEKGA